MTASKQLLQWCLCGVIAIVCVLLGLMWKQSGIFLMIGNAASVRRGYSPHVSWSRVPVKWQEEMKRRVKHMETICQETKHSLDGSTARAAFPPKLYVDDKHRLLMCAMPKVGCSNGKLMLNALTGNIDFNFSTRSSSKEYLPTLSWYSPFGAKLRLATYLKVIVVRHPLERLVSAYRDRLANRKRKDTKLIDAIKRFENSSTPGQKPVSFQAYIKYLISLDPNTDYNHHWENYIRLCDPCRIHYDVIARLESQGTDLNMILKLIGMDDKLRFPQNKHPASSSHVWKNYFTNITRRDIRKLWQHYELDARIFNFTLDWY